MDPMRSPKQYPWLPPVRVGNHIDHKFRNPPLVEKTRKLVLKLLRGDMNKRDTAFFYGSVALALLLFSHIQSREQQSSFDFRNAITENSQGWWNISSEEPLTIDLINQFAQDFPETNKFILTGANQLLTLHSISANSEEWTAFYNTYYKLLWTEYLLWVWAISYDDVISKLDSPEPFFCDVGVGLNFLKCEVPPEGAVWVFFQSSQNPKESRFVTVRAGKSPN